MSASICFHPATRGGTYQASGRLIQSSRHEPAFGTINLADGAGNTVTLFFHSEADVSGFANAVSQAAASIWQQEK